MSLLSLNIVPHFWRICRWNSVLRRFVHRLFLCLLLKLLIVLSNVFLHLLTISSIVPVFVMRLEIGIESSLQSMKKKHEQGVVTYEYLYYEQESYKVIVSTHYPQSRLVNGNDIKKMMTIPRNPLSMFRSIPLFSKEQWKDVYLHTLQCFNLFLGNNYCVVVEVTFLFILNRINELICLS